MSEISDKLHELQAMRDRSERAEFSEAIRITSPFADYKTTLFSVLNSKLNHFFVLARDKADALKIVENHGHVINRKLARIKVADRRDFSLDLQKFFSAAAQAQSKRAQGIVTNQNGFAVMKHGGQIYMPLTVVGD